VLNRLKLREVHALEVGVASKHSPALSVGTDLDQFSFHSDLARRKFPGPALPLAQGGGLSIAERHPLPVQGRAAGQV
jgi:hypothetical protein